MSIATQRGQDSGRRHGDELLAALRAFVDERVLPAEAAYHREIEEAGDPQHHPAVMEELKREARARGLWNLFLQDPARGPGLTNLEFAPLAEEMGRTIQLAAEATNCSAPDTGNMELLAEYATESQAARWLRPLLDGEIRSAFSMTEPFVGSSDATNIRTRIVRDGDEYVVSGRKWFTSGAASSRCAFAIVLGVSNPDGPRHRRHSMLIVPLDHPGVRIVRRPLVYGYDEPRGGHPEILFDAVRVPADHLLGREGHGFAMAQSRLGPGRIHHCMRLIGMAERALELLCRRAVSRVTFGQTLASQGLVQDWIAESRIEIDQARLLTLHAARLMDTAGKKAAQFEIAEIKVVAARMAVQVIDRAIQLHGARGVTEDTPLAEMWAHARTLMFADGPDEVHKMVLARRELQRQTRTQWAGRS